MASQARQSQMMHFRDYDNWRDKSGFTFLEYPFCIDAGSKAQYLHLDNRIQRRRARHRNFLGMMMQRLNNNQLRSVSNLHMLEEVDLTLVINRNNLIQDALIQVCIHIYI